MIQTKPFERIYSFLTVLSWSLLFTLCNSFSAFDVVRRTNAVHRSQYFAWDDNRIASQRLLTLLEAAKVGIFYGTSTGTTADVAYRIAAGFGAEVADEPLDIDELKGNVAATFAKYESLVIGTPTWNTGADTERSGTAWDYELYNGEVKKLDVKGKNVAVFGLGDSVSYSDNYADATGELHDIFQTLGCNMMGYTSQEGYEHTASKSIRGDLFCGLLCDNVNQEELTPGRVKNWVEQLKKEGFLKETTGTSVLPTSTVTAFEIPQKNVRDDTPVATSIINETPVSTQSILEGFVPHHNSKTGVTMW
eukprot:CAMPEP_0172419602 /NCGR_PEP_ID=MMETSP1064-20121228/6009_1 /TAXON_ID=202472 /ORGANISM="Aulacoseira subarctica , Strain CCAP 1002/5" /LENGTH=305 /DNA_ID=CAMNT_0013159147 /DNA_START=107 /DNA_END=1021 /DNA_ORIENTATION=+